MPEIYITLEIGPGGAAAAAAALEAALKGAQIASLLIRAPEGCSLDPGIAKTLVSLAQKRGVASLIASDANLARMIKADGLHLPWSKDIVKNYREARAELGEHAMIGSDAGRSRDAAMQLGEAGADYVAFGIPPHVEDRTTAEARQCDLVSWWSEIFEIPCVAFDAASVAQAHDLAQAGADFVVVTVTSATPASEIERQIAAFAQTILPADAVA